MRNSILVLLVMAACAGAVQRQWKSSSSTDMNDSANYTGSGALLETDTLVFDDSSDVNATATAPLSVAQITSTADYSGAWSCGGNNITVASGVAFDHTGTLTLACTLTVSGNADFHIGSGVGTVTATSLSIVTKGTGNLDIDKTGLTVKSLDLAYAGKTTTHTSATALGTTALIFNGDAATAGTFTNSQTLTVTGVSDYTFSPRGGTIAGTGTLLLYINAVNGVITVDSITSTGTGTIVLGSVSANASTVNMAGNISATSGTIRLYKNGNGPVTINTNDYSIDVNNLIIGNQRSTDTLKVNMGASAISAGSLNNTTYNAGATTLNLQTSTWAVTGDFDIGSNTTIIRGTSQVALNGTAAATLTTNNQTFYDIVMAKTANGVTLQDSLKVAGDLTVSDGTFTQNKKPVVVTGDVIITSADASTIDTTWSVGGNWTFGASSTPTVTGSTVKFTGATTVTTGGKTMPACTTGGTLTVADRSTFTRLVAIGDSVKLAKRVKHTLSNCDSLNLSGVSAVGRTYLVTDSAFAPCTLDIPGARGFAYLYMRDIGSADTIRCLTGCLSGGGNYLR